MAQQRKQRRGFSPEFKLEAVRRVEERRAQGLTLTQIGRELDVRPDMLRAWKRQFGHRAGARPADVFPGHGRLPSRKLPRQGHSAKVDCQAASVLGK
jgi:transposase-like protein